MAQKAKDPREAARPATNDWHIPILIGIPPKGAPPVLTIGHLLKRWLFFGCSPQVLPHMGTYHRPDICALVGGSPNPSPQKGEKKTCQKTSGICLQTHIFDYHPFASVGTTIYHLESTSG